MYFGLSIWNCSSSFSETSIKRSVTYWSRCLHLASIASSSAYAKHWWRPVNRVLFLLILLLIFISRTRLNNTHDSGSLFLSPFLILNSSLCFVLSWTTVVVFRIVICTNLIDFSGIFNYFNAFSSYFLDTLSYAPLKSTKRICVDTLNS